MYKFSLKKIVISIAIIIVLLCAFFYLTKREPSSKYAAKTVVHLDEKLKQYDNLLKNYDGLNSDLYTAVEKKKAEIKELQVSLDLTKEEKEKVEKHLEENDKKIEDIKNKCKNVEKNICLLNGELIDLEKQKIIKEAEIKIKEEQLAKELDEAVRKQLRDEIKQLQDEQNKIIQKIVDVKREIDKCVAKKKKYTNILTRAEEYKKILEDRYTNLTKGEQALFKQITTRENRIKQIQAQINENKQNKIELQKKIDTIRLERETAEACRLACDDWDKAHEASFGNIRDAIFDGFDKVADFATDRGLLKAVSHTSKIISNITTTTVLAFHEVEKVLDTLKLNYYDNNGKPKKMSKETYDSIVARTEGELKELKDKFDKCEVQTNKLLEDQKETNITKAEDDAKKQIKNIETRDKSEIDAYEESIFILEDEIANIGELDGKFKQKENLEETNEQYNERINANKNQLKQKSPSFNARDNHARDMRYTRYGFKTTKR
jgi:chromosome segregation ATPase